MRLERLLAIVMILINKKKITAKELAEYFEVSIRTIHRDIDIINRSGIPIISYQGYKGGYGIIDTYKFDKNFFTKKELDLIITSLEAVYKTYEDNKIKTVIDKLNTVKNKEIEDTDNKIIMDFSPWVDQKNRKEIMNNIRVTIDNEEVILIEYMDLNGNRTKREIEPITLILKMYTWYVYGYCRLRMDFRLFKLSRIISMENTQEKFIPKKNKHDFTDYKNDQRKKTKIKLKFNDKALSKLDDYFELSNLEYNDDGYIYTTVKYPEDEWVYSMLLSFGENVEVIEPLHIKEIIKSKASNILKKYNYT